jgi:hypothetical protein
VGNEEELLIGRFPSVLISKRLTEDAVAKEKVTILRGTNPVVEPRNEKNIFAGKTLEKSVIEMLRSRRVDRKVNLVNEIARVP